MGLAISLANAAASSVSFLFSAFNSRSIGFPVTLRFYFLELVFLIKTPDFSSNLQKIDAVPL